MAKRRQISSSLFPSNTANLKIAVFCLISATIFWFFTALNKDYSATIRYPVNFDFDSDQYIATDELPDQVQINVSGLGWTIFRSGYLFSAEPIFVKVDNPERDNKIPGSNLRGIISEGLSDLELNYVLSDTLFLSVERKLSKKVRVVVDSAGINLADDFFITSPISQELDSVEITGPRTFIENSSDSIWLRIYDRRLNVPFSQPVTVELAHALAISDPSEILLDFQVDRFVPVNLAIPLTPLNFPADSSVFLQDSVCLLSMWVNENRENEINEEEFMIVADYDRMVTYDSTIYPLILEFPSDIKRLSRRTQRVKLGYSQ